ncbi:prepilin-type N-terminal cleavage/methylation domain-containing protein [Candidatus Falkowbacteria bacterium]|nr:prepilin-type N-terminal cleavage/methylation domain-containing protein [Candidatus Falkowbacteria bacterium]
MRRPTPQHGFTLLETLMALAIFATVVILASTFVIKSYQASNFGQEQNEAIENARRGIETMIKEIRASGQSDEGGYIILTNEPQSLTFYSDIDKDTVLEQIHYWLDGTDFKKGVIEPNAENQYLAENATVTILSRYVRNADTPIFTYYGGDYPAVALPYEPVMIDNIRLINIYLEVNVDPSKAPRSYILESKANIRTLKDNL